MSKNNQWILWIGVTAALLWFLLKPQKAIAAPTPGAGSTFAVPQTGAAITAGGAAQAAHNNNPLSGSPLAAIPGLQNLLSGLANAFKGGSNSGPKLPNASFSGGGGGGGGRPGPPAAPTPAPPAAQPDTGQGLTFDPNTQDMFDSNFDYGFGMLDPGGELQPPGPVETPLPTTPTISAPADTSVPDQSNFDPGGELPAIDTSGPSTDFSTGDFGGEGGD